MTTRNRILVVDDTKKNLESALMLRERGFELDLAKDMSEAVKVLGTDYDHTKRGTQHYAVLTDLYFPLGESRDHAKEARIDSASYYEDPRSVQPLGFQLVLYAAKLDIPKIGMLTDLNHHDNSIAATFDLLHRTGAADERLCGVPGCADRRPLFRINNSDVALCDIRDVTSLLKRLDTNTYEVHKQITEDEGIRRYGAGYADSNNWEDMSAKNWLELFDGLHQYK